MYLLLQIVWSKKPRKMLEAYHKQAPLKHCGMAMILSRKMRASRRSQTPMELQ
uniref:Uncharacterized protein n=1 Tax=Anguilla anguilla TaxID=7936 RepID=A0A0E9P977_ANGAN